MTETLLTSFGAYGPWLVLFGVFLDAAGLVPIPGEIYLLIAGALTHRGDQGFFSAVLLGALGAFLGDHVTYSLGRMGVHGKSLIDLYCKYTLCSARCSLTTQRLFTRFGGAALLFGRFMIGVRTLACPLAGASGMPYARFAFYDLAGAFLWSMMFVSVGFLFSPQLQALIEWIARATHSVIPLFLMTVALLIAYRYYRRRTYGPAEEKLSPIEPFGNGDTADGRPSVGGRASVSVDEPNTLG
ncbi:MAG: DedA family protein [Nitrospirae bacterium]|nr:DedA family protein [Nitrospirota bacterium]